MTLSAAQVKALMLIAEGGVSATNANQTGVKGLTAQTVASLLRLERKTPNGAGLIVKDGSRRSLVNGRAARALQLTKAGWSHYERILLGVNG